jgi:hypothetical protein
MPDIAVLDDKIITTTDIYKFSINKQSPFLCFNCDKPLHFRQSRNADKNYTDHFYHPNTVKDTHVDCESNTLERIRDNDTWHNKMSDLIDKENREVIRKNDAVKHIVDAYDSANEMGIEFQNSPISVEAIQSRDATTYLDWIFNVENQFMRRVQIGNRIVCEIPHQNWENAVKAVKNSVYLYTGHKEWILLEDRESYRIEIEGRPRNVWIGKPCSFKKLHDETCLQNMLTQEGLAYFQAVSKEIIRVPIVYARCKKSMFLLDGIHRRYVNRHQFQPNEVVAIKSVAGSGKTTTLLELAKIHTTKKILYLAFNKSLIDDIGVKIRKQAIRNLYPRTFHSIVYEAYKSNKNTNPIMSELRPQTLHTFIPFFKGKPFTLRKYYIDMYTRFCAQPTYLTPNEYTMATKNKEEPLLNSLWNKTLANQLITYDSLIKLAQNHKWLKGYIDKTYDMIMIDETQDLDIMMLTMLLNDTTIPKIFVGDPLQSIYKWRGCINGFEHLPTNSLIIEFYSTFRVGDPACEIIRKKFDNCWIISKSQNQTVIVSDVSTIKDEKYTYLFRTWRRLLTSARTMNGVWISNYHQQVEKMRTLHSVLKKFGGSLNEEEFPDDLPMFLRSLSEGELEALIAEIDGNLTSKEEAQYKFYTIHSYKGLEDDNIRIAGDMEDMDGEKDKNLYYVALTRGMKTIVEDQLTTQQVIRPIHTYLNGFVTRNY